MMVLRFSMTQKEEGLVGLFVVQTQLFINNLTL